MRGREESRDFLNLRVRNESDGGGGSHARRSRLYLPKFESSPATILDYLLARFPQVHPTIWRGRITRGLVTLSDGTTVNEDSPYRHGMTVFYQKEVPSEPASMEEAIVIHHDED